MAKEAKIWSEHLQNWELMSIILKVNYLPPSPRFSKGKCKFNLAIKQFHVQNILLTQSLIYHEAQGNKFAYTDVIFKE
jgi:hypothetical protein